MSGQDDRPVVEVEPKPVLERRRAPDLAPRDRPYALALESHPDAEQHHAPVGDNQQAAGLQRRAGHPFNALVRLEPIRQGIDDRLKANGQPASQIAPRERADLLDRDTRVVAGQVPAGGVEQPDKLVVRGDGEPERPVAERQLDALCDRLNGRQVGPIEVLVTRASEPMRPTREPEPTLGRDHAPSAPLPDRDAYRIEPLPLDQRSHCVDLAPTADPGDSQPSADFITHMARRPVALHGLS